MALKVVMFSDFVCPFCYIGFKTLRDLKSEFDFQYEWRGFQIHPEWPAEGIPAQQAAPAADRGARRALWERITMLADAIGLVMKPPTVFTNSRLALEAAEFARELGRDEDFAARVYRAYFQEDANIGDRVVVAELAAAVGIARAQLDAALESGKYSLKLKNNALAAHQRGVSGVPTFIINGFPLVGAQSTDVMRQVMKRAAERLSAEQGVSR
jgi:predicted DsbA family dithiol-disulfide isomerase